ncbi:MAG: glycoside hydrolase family 97 N-terminal domain-containing protein, partial [Balneolaceae bacterium]|nr:glycoside hydrolase family 97 N-terminal domain-containing protein [Balneolaceae bacterium]
MRTLYNALLSGVICLLATSIAPVTAQDVIRLNSPDRQTEVRISVGETIQYEVLFNGEQVLAPSKLSLTIDGIGTLGKNPDLERQTRNLVDRVLEPVVPRKSSTIRDRYHQPSLQFAGNYSVEFRAYNDGIAYRFVTDLGEDQIRIRDEQLEFNFVGDHTLCFP